ncbi:MAG: HEAT repeat domain-containing protein, partial [Pseudomonadota bacterium]
MVETKRKGAARVADVPPDILAQLNAGEIESATLSESLAIDFATLLRSVLPDLSNKADRVDPKAGITKRMSKVAEIIFEADGLSRLSWRASHPSDLVRGWGAYLLALDDQRSLPEQVEAMRPFADDPHFGVREWAWLALRPAICADPEAAISALIPWTGDASENIRRFACEA